MQASTPQERRCGLAQALVDGEDYNLEEDIQRLREIREDTRLGPSTGSIVEEAAKRGIPLYPFE
jgi:cyanophycin synthetase